MVETCACPKARFSAVSIARGVIGVAASIDEFLALVLTINSSSAPPPPELPQGGNTVHQAWSPFPPDPGLTADLYDGRAVDDQTVAQFRNPVPADSLDGLTVLVHRGTCAGSLKTFNAQEAGATALIMINNAFGAPTALASGGQDVTIPAYMIAEALAVLASSTRSLIRNTIRKIVPITDGIMISR